MTTSLRNSLLAASLLVATTVAFAQTPYPTAPVMDHGTAMAGKQLASPPADAAVKVGAGEIKIHYNSPAVRCRKIFGDLVPYGQVWRTGANPATSFVTTTELKIGSLTVPAGKYTLYTMPAAPGTPWQLIINKQTGQWGTEYHQDKDLGRVPMTGATLPKSQERMSISFDKTTGHSTVLHIRWDKTDEFVRIEAK
jgi:hypothetical protein